MTASGAGPGGGGPEGYTYAAALVRHEAGPGAREPIVDLLRGLRFTGWVAPHDDGWTAVVAAGAGTVAAGRRGVVGVGEALASEFPGAVVVVRVIDDGQLALVAWDAGREVARYVSDPSREPGAGADVLDSPVGFAGAAAIATACGHPDSGEDLRELLAEPLGDDEIESERLARMLRLLGLPAWLVTSWRLPRRISTGPRPRDLVRLVVGRTGPVGLVTARADVRARRRRTPPPVLIDPPRGHGDLDDPMMWL